MLALDCCDRKVLHADAYAGFNELYRDRRTTEAAYWAHARGKIHDVHARIPLERQLAERQWKTKPPLNTLGSWLREKKKTLSRHAELAKTFTYAQNQCSVLPYYTEKDWVEADNYIAKNALRMVSLGCKNGLLFGSDHSGERGAQLHSLIDTYKQNDVGPESYLHLVLDVMGQRTATLCVTLPT
jgi:transposase